MNIVLIEKTDSFTKAVYIKNENVEKIRVFDNSEKYIENDIFLGRKLKENKSLNSLLLDFGEFNGFLETKKDLKKDLRLCQIKKINKGEKNIKLKDEVILKGNNIIYILNGKGISFSKKLSSVFLNKIENIIKKEIPKFENRKIIIRSEVEEKYNSSLKEIGEEKSLKLLIKSILKEVSTLEKVDKFLRGKEKLSLKQGFLYRQFENYENFIFEIKDEIQKVVTNEKEIYNSLIKRNFENVKEIIFEDENNKVNYLLNGKVEYFKIYNIDKILDELMVKKVIVKENINIVIEKTEAMYVIDVNSGGYEEFKDKSKNGFAVNNIALETIVRQIELRNLSGIIAIDFINMANKTLSEKLRYNLQNLLKKSLIKSQVDVVTKSDVLIIIRESNGPSIMDILECKDTV